MARESKSPDPEDLPFLAESTPVYTFFGHSCSTGEMLRVPPGCMLVTLAFCGSPTYNDEVTRKFDELFVDPGREHLLLDPVGNKASIEAYLNIPENTLNINHPDAEHEENRFYMNTLYDAQLATDYNPFQAHPSGLYKYNEHIYTRVYEDVLDKLDDNTFVHDIIEHMYPETVIYPEHKQVIKIVNELVPIHVPHSRIIEHIGDKFKTSQQELFERFPGIYYLVTCRNPCGGLNVEARRAVERRRRTSRPWLTEEQLEANRKKAENVSSTLRLENERMAQLRSNAATELAIRAAREAEAAEAEAAAMGGAVRLGAGAGASAGHKGGRRSMRRTRRHKRRTAKRGSKAYHKK